MSLNRFFGYFGAKHVLAKHYPAPRHRTIIEPFAGSAGYATRYHDRDVILVEKNPILAAMWRWLLRASPREILALPDLEDGQTVDDLGLSAEARSLVGFWLGDGATQPATRLHAWARRRKAERGAEDSWCRSIRGRLASQVTKIRHWQIIEGDYTEAPDIEATWFIDPPYEKAGTKYVCGSGGLDFTALASWCRSRRGQVIVCENEGATWLPFRPFKRIQGIREAGRSSTAEAIWTNDPMDGERAAQ